MSKKITYFPEIKEHPQLKRMLTNLVGNELTAMSSPCYYGKFVKYYQDLMKITGITDENIREFRNKNIDKKYHSFAIFNNRHTTMSIMCVIFFSRKGDLELARLFYLFLALKFQSSLMHKFFSKYCNDDIFSLSLDRVSHKHLYRVRGGISNAVSYMATEEFNRSKHFYKSPSLTDDIVVKRCSNALRNRLAQSIRSFAGVYYAISEERGHGMKKSTEDIPSDKIQLIAEKISQQICIFGNIDKKNLRDAVLKSGLRKEIGIEIVSELSSSEYKESIKFIIVLINRLAPINNLCKENKRLTTIRKIEGKEKVDKYSVYDEINNVIKSLPSAYQFKSIYSKQLVLFLSHYLTLYIRTRVC